MFEKRPAESSTEEPATKKQITPEMYEKLEAENAELKKRDTESQKRDTEAQKMTKNMIEKFQDRTGNAEEKTEMYKDLTCPSNSSVHTPAHLKHLNSDDKNTLAIVHHTVTFEIERYFIPGKPSNTGIDVHNKNKITAISIMKNNKCSICNINRAKYAHNQDIYIFSYEIMAKHEYNTYVPTKFSPSVRATEKPIGLRWTTPVKTLCKDCILNFNLENTTYVESPPTVDLSSSTAASAISAVPDGGKNTSLLKFLERKEVTGTLNPQQKLQLSGLRSDLA